MYTFVGHETFNYTYASRMTSNLVPNGDPGYAHSRSQMLQSCKSVLPTETQLSSLHNLD